MFDRDSGAYLLRFAWTKIVRHQMVQGTSSPDERPGAVMRPAYPASECDGVEPLNTAICAIGASGWPVI
jgi:hypothetical protein